MTRFLWTLLVWVSFAALLPIEGVVAADIKIGLIDMEKIMRESKPAKDARAIILEDLKSKNALYNEKQEKVKALEEEVRKAGTRDVQARKKGDELAKEVKELQRLKADLEEELNKKNAEFTQKILAEVAEILKAFQKDNKYNLILERKNVVLADDSVDITDKVIQLYDKKTKK